MKASPIKYAAAKRIALTTIIKQPPDTPIPDRIAFMNDDDGFQIHFAAGNSKISRMVSWEVVETSIEAIAETVKRAMAELAKANH